MNWQYVFVTLSLFTAALISTGLALFAWLRRVAAWSRPFAILMLAIAQWSLGYAMELGATEVDVKLFWAQIQYVGIVVAPVAWFLFVVRYIGRERWLQRRYVSVLSLIPLATLILVMTNETHGLIWQEVALDRNWPFIVLNLTYGPWFWLFVGYAYLLTLGGTVFLYRALRRQFAQEGAPDGWALYVIMLSPLLPLAGNALYLLGFSPLRQIDFTPLAFAFSAMIISWAILRHHLFDLVPVARQTVLDSMSDGVLVINIQERIVDINPAGQRILGRSADQLVGFLLPEALPAWAEQWQTVKEEGAVDTEVSIEHDSTLRYYNLRISSLYSSEQHVGGHLMVLRDITERKEAEAQSAARQRLFANLVAIARATAEGPSLQATLQNALDVATGLTDAEYGSLFLLDSDGRVTNSILARGTMGPGSQRKIVGQVMDQGLAGWVVRHRQAALVRDTWEDERWITLPDQPYAARSVLVVPITSGPAVPAVMTLQHSEPQHFDEEDAELMRAASDQMALALRNAQIYETQRRLAERQAVLYEALTRIGEHLEPETMTQVAVETVATLTNWPAVAILVAEDGQLVVRAATGLLAAAEGERLEMGAGISGLAYQSGETRVVRDLRVADQYVGDSPELCSALYVPLRHGNSRMGVFAVESTELDGFSDDDIWLAESLAEALALAMANAQLFKAVADEHSRLQALIESSRDGILLIGVNRQLLVANHTALEYLNLAGGPPAWVQRPLADLLDQLRQRSPDVVEEALVEVRRIRTGDETLGDGEFRVNGRTLQWTSVPVMAGELALGRLIVLQDVTQEQMLQRIRDDLTHTMVHDLRNPLNVVSSALEMLEDRVVPAGGSAEVAQMMEIARDGTERMLELVNGILSISQLEEGRMPMMRRPVDVNELVEMVLKGQRPLALEKELVLENGTIDEPLPPAFADPGLIGRVLQNLIGNAIKFTPHGGKITVRTTAGDDDVRITVADSGPGIRPEVQEQLFQKFVTGEEGERGSGLGLAFCRMAVETHGGEIWVESAPDEGAAFSFTLPQRDRDEEGAQPST